MGRFHIFGDSWVRGDGLGSEHSFSWFLIN